MNFHSNKLMRFAPWAAVVFALVALGGCTSTSTGLGLAPTAVSSTAQPQPMTARDLLAELDGGLIGRIPALQLRSADRVSALEAEYRALEYTAPSQPVYWQSSNQAISGTVIPSQPYRVGTQDCRQYTSLVTTVAGTVERRGTACRNENGSWSLLS